MCGQKGSPKTPMRQKKTLQMVYASMFAVVIAVCAWITIPTAVPFTLQTFAVFLAVGVLGGRLGSIAVAVYLLLGAVGIPVFSGFRGGVGALLGVTGGYIWGFLAATLLMWWFEKLFGRGTIPFFVSMLLGLVTCYALGTVWYAAVYAGTTGTVSVAPILIQCVLPFIIPDILKVVLVCTVRKRIMKAFPALQRDA